MQLFETPDSTYTILIVDGIIRNLILFVGCLLVLFILAIAYVVTTRKHVNDGEVFNSGIIVDSDAAYSNI